MALDGDVDAGLIILASNVSRIHDSLLMNMPWCFSSWQYWL